MSSIAEIEAAIESLPEPQIDELVRWIDSLRSRRISTLAVESWLNRARGSAVPGLTTEAQMAITRGEG